MFSRSLALAIVAAFMFSADANALEPEWSDFCVEPFLAYANLKPGTLKTAKVRTTMGDISVLRNANADSSLPTLVFIHSNSGCKETFVRVIEHLGNRVNIIAVDLPGHGQSDNANVPVRTYSFQGYAANVIEVLDALEVQQFIPVGWSLGGHVAMEMMHMYPKRLKGVVTTGSPAMPKGLLGPLKAFNVFRMWWKGVLQMIGQDTPFTEQEARFFLESGGVENPSAFFIEAAMRTDPRARSMMQASIQSGCGVVDQKELLEHSEIPVGIAIGVNDPGVNADYIRRSIPSYKRTTGFEFDTDHGVVWNRPEDFAAFLLDFTRLVWRLKS